MNKDIGFHYGSGTFPDESLATSSEQFDKDHANPRDGRLYKPSKFWCPSNISKPSYLELILVEKYFVFAVSVQGRRLTSDENFAINFGLSYSENYAHWRSCNSKFRVSFHHHFIFMRIIEYRCRLAKKVNLQISLKVCYCELSVVNNGLRLYCAMMCMVFPHHFLNFVEIEFKNIFELENLNVNSVNAL